MSAPDLPPARDPADDSHLRTLSICHYVMAAISLCGCGGYGAFMAIMGGSFSTMIKTMPSQPGMEPPPPEMADAMQNMFAGMAVVYVFGGVVLCVLQVLAGIGLGGRKWLPLCYIAAGLSCLQFPLGTVLGIFTFVVLSRRSVQEQFEAQASGGR